MPSWLADQTDWKRRKGGFEGGFTETLDLRAGSADVVQNHLAGTAGTCDVCLAGPGSFRASGNRLLAGGIPGITVTSPVGLPVPAGVEPLALPATAETWAEVRNNEVRDYQREPVGVGIRVEAVGIGAPNVHGTIHAVIQDNLLVNDRFGIIVHAAFPVPNTDRRGDVDVTLGGNVFQQSCQTDLLVSLSRHTNALGLTSRPYLVNSTFQLALGGDVAWDEAWFSHPAGFGNTLVVDRQTIANGSRQFYDAVGVPGAGGFEPWAVRVCAVTPAGRAAPMALRSESAQRLLELLHQSPAAGHMIGRIAGTPTDVVSNTFYHNPRRDYRPALQRPNVGLQRPFAGLQ